MFQRLFLSILAFPLMGHYFLSCDWGTSSFRLRWVNQYPVHGDPSDPLHFYQDSTGSKVIFEEARRLGDTSESARASLYSRFLRNVLEKWNQHGEKLVAPIPLVISGMASSTIGWKELPYAPAPLLLNASNLRYELISWERPAWVGNTYLISGVATDHEIMRGEETEAIGLLDKANLPGRTLLILPGTHSKHILVEEDRISTFWTYMTGEVFEVLARNSLLRASVDWESLKSSDAAKLAAFDAGVRQAREDGLGISLFRTRTRTVLGGCPPAENTWFLSGLLVGAELADLGRRFPGIQILLGGTADLRALYARAFQVLGFESSRWEELKGNRIETAIPRAHGRFLQQRNEWKL